MSVSKIWGKKDSHPMVIPPEQQKSMNRFLSPGPSINSFEHRKNTLDNSESIQKMNSNRNLFQNESKEKIANFKQLHQ